MGRHFDPDEYAYQLDKTMANVMPSTWEGHERIAQYEAEQ